MSYHIQEMYTYGVGSLSVLLDGYLVVVYVRNFYYNLHEGIETKVSSFSNTEMWKLIYVVTYWYSLRVCSVFQNAKIILESRFYCFELDCFYWEHRFLYLHYYYYLSWTQINTNPSF